MKRTIFLPLASGTLGLLFGGGVGFIAGVVVALGSGRTDVVIRRFLLPIFGLMVLATLVEGRFVQEMSFGSQRPLAHRLGLALAVGLIVVALADDGGDRTSTELGSDSPETDETAP